MLGDLAGPAVTDAVSQESRGYRGVTGATARLVGDDAAPQLVLRLQLVRRADIAVVRRISSSAVAHVRQVLYDPETPVEVDLVVTDDQAAWLQ